jgi:hypothetical protein
MPRAVVVLFTLIVVAASSSTASSQSPAPPGFTVVARADLYTGVDYMELAKTKVPVVTHVAHVRPGAPVDLRIVNAHDKISTTPRDLETTSSMCGRVRCIVGVNGDFVRAGEPAGAVVVDGRMLHSPDPSRPQLTVANDGHLAAGPFPWTGSLTAGDGSQIAVNAVNTAPPGNGLTLYTPAYGARTDPSSRTELVVKALNAVGALNQPADVELRGIRSGAGPIPPDGAVLSGDGAAGQQLLDLWARRQNGAASRARVLVSSPVDARTSLGAEPVVLHNGRRALPWRDPNLVNPRQPHTLVGWNDAGDIYLVAVDGRQQASEGVTMAEAADFLLGLGATEAVNLDGGGGTTFVAGGSVWNRPSDNDPVRPAEYQERGTGNALVVMAQPGAPLPPVSPSPPAPLAATPPSAAGPRSSGAPTKSVSSTPGPAAPGQDGDGPLGPLGGLGARLADGELPVGPSSAGPGSSPVSATPLLASLIRSGTAPQGPDATPVGPAGTASDGRGGDPSTSSDAPALLAAASNLTRRVVGAATSADLSWTGSNALRAGAITLGAALLMAGAGRRRRRRVETGNLA